MLWCQAEPEDRRCKGLGPSLLAAITDQHRQRHKTGQFCLTVRGGATGVSLGSHEGVRRAAFLLRLQHRIPFLAFSNLRRPPTFRAGDTLHLPAAVTVQGLLKPCPPDAGIRVSLFRGRGPLWFHWATDAQVPGVRRGHVGGRYSVCPMHLNRCHYW